MTMTKMAKMTKITKITKLQNFKKIAKITKITKITKSRDLRPLRHFTFLIIEINNLKIHSELSIKSDKGTEFAILAMFFLEVQIF